MKFTLAFTLYFLLHFTTYGQKFTIAELLKLQKNNTDFFENSALKKGYEYSSTDRDSDVTTVSYSLYKLNGKRSTNILNYYKWKNDLQTLLYLTSERQEYLSLKYEVEKLGYKFFKTEQLKDEIATFFKKEEMLIGFNTSINVSNENIENQLFSIDIRPSILLDN